MVGTHIVVRDTQLREGSTGRNRLEPTAQSAWQSRGAAPSSLVDLLHEGHQTILIKLYPVRRDVVPHSEVEDPSLVADR